MVPDRATTYHVADLAVTCAPREPGRRMTVEPVLVVEIRSPAPDEVNQWRKVASYRSLPAVQEVLVVFSDERRVEVQRRTRDGWRVEDLIGRAQIRLACCDSPARLDAVYRDLLPENAAGPN